jgi:TRAP-type C4-dicarboxylate transport system permease large subunit
VLASSGFGLPMAMLRVWEWDWDVDLDSVLDFVLWCLPLLLVACLIGSRVVTGGQLDPVADAAAAAAAAVAIANVLARRLKLRCFWRRKN